MSRFGASPHRGILSVATAAMLCGVVLALVGCAPGGDEEAAVASAAMGEVEGVESASVLARQEGFPWSRKYSVVVTVEEGLDDRSKARVVQDVVVVAAEELEPTASVSVSFSFYEDSGNLDLRDAQDHLEFLQAFDVATLSRGTFSLFPEELREHAPEEEAT